MKEEIIEILKKEGTVISNYIVFDLSSYKYVYFGLDDGALIVYTDVFKTGVSVPPKVYYFSEEKQECTNEELEELLMRMRIRVLINESTYDKKKKFVNPFNITINELCG
jgi:hypothetical protein